MSSLDRLPNESRIWIFALNEESAPGKIEIIRRGIDQILSNWKTHGTPLAGAAEIVANRFLIIAADEEVASASGCSIDSLNNSVKALAAEAGVEIAPYDAIFFRDGGNIRQIGRNEFGTLVSQGKIGPQTIVFDNSITKLAQFKGGKWELPFADSWHSRAF